MATKRTFWECSFCRRLFDGEGQAGDCENHHAAMSYLKVIDSMSENVNSDDCFPESILLKSDHRDDLVAEYELKRQGATADFYQSEEQWHQP